MKKILIGLLLVFLLVGCSKNSEGSVVRNLTKKINNISAYKIDGELELVNNDEVYTYDISVSYKKDNYYLVSLTNLANNSNQVILKNGEGVFVITPALNKSFKFQSDWPYDNSQIYLLEALMKDIKNSTNRSFKTLVAVGKSGEHYVYVIPVALEVDFKKAAKAVGEKNVELIHVKDLTKLTGYIRGGCSPLGMKKNFKTVIHTSCLDYDKIYISGGRVGLTLELAPKDLIKVTKAEVVDIVM